MDFLFYNLYHRFILISSYQYEIKFNPSQIKQRAIYSQYSMYKSSKHYQIIHTDQSSSSSDQSSDCCFRQQTEQLSIHNIQSSSIASKIKKYRGYSLKEIHITNDTYKQAINNQDIDDIVLVLRNMFLQYLKVFSLRWTQELSKESIMKIISILPQTIQQVHFYNSRYFDNECYMRLLERCQKLNKLTVNIIGSQAIRHYYQDRHFMDLQPLQIHFQQNNLNQLLEQFKPKNLNIMDCIAQQQQNILSQTPYLENLLIGKHFWNQELIYSIIENISVLSLKNISMLNIEKCSRASKIWYNKQQMQAISLYYCSSITQDFIQYIVNNCLQLQTLSLYGCWNCSYSGKGIWNLTSLTTLILNEQNNIHIESAYQGLKKLVSLTYIDLGFNYSWVNNKILACVTELPKIQYLNIECTKITTQGLKKITALKFLKTLICGNNTKIDPWVISTITTQLPSLRKLSIKGQPNLKKEHIDQLGQCHWLTHLNFKSCQQINDSMLKNLGIGIKFINLQQTGVSKKFCSCLRSKNITVKCQQEILG